MTSLIYVEAVHADIAATFLRQAAAGAELAGARLFAKPASMAVAAELAARFGLSCHVLPEDPGRPAALSLRPIRDEIFARGGAAEAVLCCRPTPFAMVFRNNEVSPAYNDQYPAIRVFHAMGVRRFRFVDEEATRALEIPHLLDEFVGRHRGERAFVVGNGPSLRNIDMTLLKDEITFGSNRSFLGYEDWGYAFRYWGISDRLQVEMYREEYEAGVDAAAVKFFPFEYLHRFDVANACPCEILSDVAIGGRWLKFPHFGETPSALFMSFTVTITLIQIAALMGCNPIVLIGVDHNYPIARVKRRGRNAEIDNPALTTPLDELRRRSKLGWDFWEGDSVTGATHFTDKYVTNKIFVPPRTAWSETAYDYAKLWGDRNGVDIVNATPGSQLTSFPLRRYEDFFKS
jgi:hypothetical protein